MLNMGWKHALPISCALAALIFFGLWRIEVGRGEIKDVKISRLDEQIEIATLEINQCISDKTLAEKESHGFQTNLGALRRQLNSLRDNPSCVPTIPASASHGHNGASAGGVVSGSNGIRTGYLIDFAGNAEETRLKLLGCQSFVNSLYKSRGLN